MRTQLTTSENPFTTIFDLHLDENPGNKIDPPDNQGGGNAPTPSPEPDEEDSAEESAQAKEKE